MFASVIRRIAAASGPIGVAIVTVGLVGCATPEYPPAPLKADVGEYRYRIGLLDTVNVNVWRNADFSAGGPVRPDGMITTPLIEDMPVFGKTPTELARDFEKTLEKYVRDPLVWVTVTGFMGTPTDQIRVIGEAAKPQILPYRLSMTILDVMIATGGITDFADGNAATIYRQADGGKLYSVRLRDLLKRGDITANVEMKPGDILIIPQSWF